MTKIESGIKFVRSNIDQQVMEIERTQKKIQGLLDQLNMLLILNKEAEQND